MKAWLIKKFGMTLLSMSQIHYKAQFFGIPPTKQQSGAFSTSIEGWSSKLPFISSHMRKSDSRQPQWTQYYLDDLAVPVFCFDQRVDLNELLVMKMRKWFLFIQQETLFPKKHRINNPAFHPLPYLTQQGFVGFAGDQFTYAPKTVLPTKAEMKLQLDALSWKVDGLNGEPINAGDGINVRGKHSCWGAIVDFRALKLDTTTKYRWILKKDLLIEMDEYASSSFTILPAKHGVQPASIGSVRSGIDETVNPSMDGYPRFEQQQPINPPEGGSPRFKQQQRDAPPGGAFQQFRNFADAALESARHGADVSR